MARNTSIQVYDKIKANGLLSKRRFQAYDTVFNHGPLTATQVSKIAGVPGLWKRLPELRKLGVVAEVGTSQCPITGETVLLWDVTDQLPIESNSPTTNKEKILFLKATLQIASKALRDNGLFDVAIEVEKNLKVLES